MTTHIICILCCTFFVRRPSQVFYELAVLKNYAEIVAKHMCQSPFFKKLRATKYFYRMPWGSCCLSFSFDLIWLENEELQDNERQRFSKWQQRQWLVTWHGGTRSHSAKDIFPNAELSLHNLGIFRKFMK